MKTRILVVSLAVLAAGLFLIEDVRSAVQGQAANPPNNSTPGTTTANAARSAVYKVDVHQITLRPKQGIEYKYQMEKGTTMVYSWKVTGGLVNHEFHGEPNGAPRGYADTYLKEDAKDQSHGSFVAPSTGIHGWYWENTSDRDVTVAIHAAGFFSTAYTIDRNGRVPRDLSDVTQQKR